jgi:DNA-directed RNA polymerase subunit H (RpoH/RPB5)
MDVELLDLISRTRPVILEILGNRGYDVTALENKVPTATTLDFTVSRTIKVEDADVQENAHVKYFAESCKQRIETILTKMWDELLDPERDEVLIVLSEPYHEVFDLQAIKMWGKRKARVSFFNIRHIISNPAKHSVVPPHRKLSESEAEAVLAKHHVRHKSELPRILYHIDMQARVLGLRPGDIVEIRRPSPTSGEYIIYRVCTLS